MEILKKNVIFLVQVQGIFCSNSKSPIHWEISAQEKLFDQTQNSPEYGICLLKLKVSSTGGKPQYNANVKKAIKTQSLHRRGKM